MANHSVLTRGIKYGVGLALACQLVACSTVTEKYAAKESKSAFNLEKAFQAHLAQKYGPGQSGTNRLKFYDELPGTNDAFIEKLRANDDGKKTAIREEMRRLNESVQQNKAVLGRLDADAQAVRARLKVSADKKIALEKKSTVKNDQTANIAQVEAEIIETTHRLNMLLTEQNMLTEVNNDLRQQLVASANELGVISQRNYLDLADQRRRDVRNELVHEMIFEADNAYLEFKNTLLAGRAGADTILDITELMISTATTLSGGVMAKANLGAASTLLKGSRTSFDKNFFAQQAIAAIINAMEDKRQVDKRVILTGLAKSTSEYSLVQALSDVRSYKSRANVMSGVLDVANQTAAQSRTSQEQLLNLTTQ